MRERPENGHTKGVAVNEEMMQRIVEVESPEGIKAIAAEYDVELSDEQASEMFADVQQLNAEQTEGELSDETLAEVSGGISYWDAFKKLFTKEGWQKIGEYMMADHETKMKMTGKA